MANTTSVKTSKNTAHFEGQMAPVRKYADEPIYLAASSLSSMALVAADLLFAAWHAVENLIARFPRRPA